MKPNALRYFICPLYGCVLGLAFHLFVRGDTLHASGNWLIFWAAISIALVPYGIVAYAFFGSQFPSKGHGLMAAALSAIACAAMFAVIFLLRLVV